jgi:hypothetical protein
MYITYNMSEHIEVTPVEPVAVDTASIQETTALIKSAVNNTLHDELKSNLAYLETTVTESLANVKENLVSVAGESLVEMKNMLPSIAGESIVEIKENLISSEALHLLNEPVAYESLPEVAPNDDVKTLAAILQLTLMQTDGLDKYSISLTPELKGVLTKLMEDDKYFDDMEKALKEIIQDDKIDAKDVPRIMVLLSDLYAKIRTMKLKFSEKMCGDVLKFIFDLALKKGIIKMKSEDLELLQCLYSIVDTSIRLMQVQIGSTKKGGLFGCLFTLLGGRS